MVEVKLEGLEGLLNKLDKLIDEEAIEKGILKTALRVEAKAKDLCPVDTGNLRASINTQSDGLTATVGTNVEYAACVEYGTRYQQAKPFLTPALEDKKDYLAEDIKSFMGDKNNA